MGGNDGSQADSGLALSEKSVSELVDSILNGQTTIASLVDALTPALAAVSWKRYTGEIDPMHEIGISYHYDKVMRPTLPDAAKDSFVRTLLEHGYFVHEFAINSQSNALSQPSTSPPASSSTPPSVFDVYVIGYTHPYYEDTGYLADLFRKLSGFDADKKREKPSVINSKFSVAVETIIGETNMWQAGSTLLSTVQEIREYCIKAGSTILEGNENQEVIDLTLKLQNVNSEIKRRIKHVEDKVTAKEMDDLDALSVVEKMNAVNRQATEAMLRMNYERARNTHMPLLESYRTQRRQGERRICIYSPELLRNPAFMGGYKPDVFGETPQTYYGGLRELAKKYQVNYIAFMRPAAQLRMG